MFKALCLAAFVGLAAGPASAAVMKAVYTGSVTDASSYDENGPVLSSFEFGLQGNDPSTLVGTAVEMVFYYEVVAPQVYEIPGYTQLLESSLGTASITMNGVTKKLAPTASAVVLEAYANSSPAFWIFHVASFPPIGGGDTETVQAEAYTDKGLDISLTQSITLSRQLGEIYGLFGNSRYSSFIAASKQSFDAFFLIDEVSVAPAPIPLPAGGFLLIGALAGLAVLRQRRLSGKA